MEKVTFDMIKEAAETIKGSVKRTQIIECPTMEKLTGNKVFFKLENLQKLDLSK